VRLAVYDVSGKLVKTLVDEVRPAGDNAFRWDGTDKSGRAVASGAYYARLTSQGVNQVRPMALIR
jgi:flagellar hook assembly protein FlgD